MKNLFVAFVLLTVSISALAQRKSCECTGQSNATVYSGGDSNPLTFYSLERLVTLGTAHNDPVHCYERNVDNHSVRDVTDVLWEVAGYYRSLLPAKKPICDATAILGHLAQPNPQGPLNYGIGPGSYPSTVYEPSGGWSPKKLTAFAEPRLHLLWNPQFRSQLTMAYLPGVSNRAYRSKAA